MNWKKIELISSYGLLAAVFLSIFFLKPITGGLISNDKIKFQPMYVFTEESNMHIVRNIGNINSLMISGKVYGPGRVNVYLENKEKDQLLIYTNNQIGKDSVTSISSDFEIAEVSENLVAQGIDYSLQTEFTNVCIDTCLIEIPTDDDFYLITEVDAAALEITQLTYTLK